MALINGARGSKNITQDQRKFSVADKLWMVDPDYAVLAFFARKLAKKAVTDPEFRWFEQTSPSRQDAVNNGGGYTAGDTSIVVDDGTKFRAGDVVVNVRTGEQMRVIGVSTNTLTVSRAWGTTTAAAMNDNDVVVITGNANAEGATKRAALTNASTKKFNYTQIFREPIDVTETEAATDLYAGGSDLANLRREHLQLHLKDIERSFLFGEPKEDTSGSQPIRATGGMRSFITTNVKTVSGGNLTQPEFDDWIADLFSKGGDRKLGFLSPLIMTAIESWAKGKLFMYPKDKTYGIAITQYLSVHGILDLVLERILGENATWNGFGFGVDMSTVGYRFLSGNGINRDTRLLKNRQANDYDGIVEEYLTEAGLFMALENRSGIIKGVTTYS